MIPFVLRIHFVLTLTLPDESLPKALEVSFLPLPPLTHAVQIIDQVHNAISRPRFYSPSEHRTPPYGSAGSAQPGRWA